MGRQSGGAGLLNEPRGRDAMQRVAVRVGDSLKTGVHGLCLVNNSVGVCAKGCHNILR
jgi:hypothetical protein